MALKLVLISPSGTLERGGKLNNDDMLALGKVINRLAALEIKVAVWSNRNWLVGKIKPLEQYLSEKSGVEVLAVGRGQGNQYPIRQRAGSISSVLEKFGVKLEETVLVGARTEDMQAGVNNKLLLLRPAWYGGDLQYGFKLESILELERFCTLFGTRIHSFYWRIDDASRDYRMYALGPFSTYIQSFAKFGEDAVQAAKYEAGTLKFWDQLIISTLYFSGIIHQVDYITVYPGHSATIKEKAFHEVLSLLGKCFSKPFLVDFILRHEDAIKSTKQKSIDRKFISQINTLRLNSNPSKYGSAPRKSAIPINNKGVLVVDDICTSGRSMDTARAYLAAAGAHTVLFSWLKTVNTDFVSMEPALELKPFEKNMITSEPNTFTYKYSNHIVDAAAATEIDNVLKAFKEFKI
ncbi:MAG: hypothetical protein Q7U05_08745 [Polaromonas sp.]|nr:hypothetical protein [Polaromonas sp.]